MRKTAAFYDMDGTLIHGNVSDHYVYYAMTDPDLSSRVRRLVELGVKAPYFWALDRIDRHMFNEVFYQSYKGLSEDRLVVMGQEMFEKVLIHRMYPAAKKLVETDRAVGRQLVLLTGAVEAVARPVAKYLGIDTFEATKLEFGSNSLATGRILPPIMAGPEKAQFVRRYAEEHDIDLENSVAYADDAADLPLLSCVGRPVAVNPDLRLATTARSHRWNVIYLDPSPSFAMATYRKARNAFDIARDLVERARAEGETRWEERDQVVDRAKKLAGTLNDLVRGNRQGDPREQRGEMEKK
jgi:HAD superfamily hydrolase (TIGR01490 family)